MRRQKRFYMISDSDLERIGKAIEAEFPGVTAHYRRESDHDFVRGIGLQLNGRYCGFRIHPSTHEESLVLELARWCRSQEDQPLVIRLWG